ncbi:MAG: prolyl oligopeptidase family serine peptidase, partial [Candidatus Neomarinimicrobiota bacterium]|nr:prolyl oligopeptidase family serine peptidase [Candidatus Neomarinimicrobiota bacterium]
MNLTCSSRTISVLPQILLFAAIVLTGSLHAQDIQKYRMPPKAIEELVNAPLMPAMMLSPSKEKALFMERPAMSGIDELSQLELRIAGLRINPATNGRSRRSHYTSLTLRLVTGGKEVKVSGLPANPKISNIAWSPDGKYLAFTVTSMDKISLWIADTKRGKAEQVMKNSLNAAYGSPFEWLSDSNGIIALTVPTGRGSAPETSLVPEGPVVQENTGGVAPARTYQDLLSSPHDEALFDHYMMSEIVHVTVKGKVKNIGKPAIYRRAEPAPDGRMLLIEIVHRPYSYLVPVYRFPTLVEVWDLNGKVIHTATDMPLAEQLPLGFGAVPTGPRSFGWRSDSDATLYWTEAQDGGDPKVDAEVRDRVFVHAAPFKVAPSVLIDLPLRYSYVQWGDGGLVLITTREWSTRKTQTWRVSPDSPGETPKLVFDRLYEDRYSNPGSPMMKMNNSGASVLLTGTGGSSIFLSGIGASPEGDRPFLDELNLETGSTKRLFRSEVPYYERPMAVLDKKNSVIITSRESMDEQPNYFIRYLKSGKTDQMTTFPHPYPQMKGVYTEMVKYKRGDGMDLTATLYLPPGRTPEDGAVPMLVWAYPREFKTSSAAAQVIGSSYRFIRISPTSSSTSALSMLVHGYGVLLNATMPIIGEGDVQPNDTYIEQLVASAQAAVDYMVERGVADRKKVAIVGHSYGAFMTANLLAHSDIFATGIARSGAYNRSLTPFGFQAEERTFWEAPEIYFAMSPFM